MKKSIDIIAQRIFATLIGLAVFTFALGTVFNNPAKADHVTATNATGKIMMHQNSFVHGGNFYWHIAVWDTETGKSKLYNFNPSNSSLKLSSYQLPSSPLY
jgi:hypothetical protein